MEDGKLNSWNESPDEKNAVPRRTGTFRRRATPRLSQTRSPSASSRRRQTGYAKFGTRKVLELPDLAPTGSNSNEEEEQTVDSSGIMRTFHRLGQSARNLQLRRRQRITGCERNDGSTSAGEHSVGDEDDNGRKLPLVMNIDDIDGFESAECAEAAPITSIGNKTPVTPKCAKRATTLCASPNIPMAMATPSPLTPRRGGKGGPNSQQSLTTAKTAVPALVTATATQPGPMRKTSRLVLSPMQSSFGRERERQSSGQREDMTVPASPEAQKQLEASEGRMLRRPQSLTRSRSRSLSRSRTRSRSRLWVQPRSSSAHDRIALGLGAGLGQISGGESSEQERDMRRERSRIVDAVWCDGPSLKNLRAGRRARSQSAAPRRRASRVADDWNDPVGQDERRVRTLLPRDFPQPTALAVSAAITSTTVVVDDEAVINRALAVRSARGSPVWGESEHTNTADSIDTESTSSMYSVQGLFDCLIDIENAGE